MSTSFALIELVEEITKSIDNKQTTIGVFIDFKKAFDHNLLIKKKWAQYYYPNFLYYISMIFTMFLTYLNLFYSRMTQIFFFLVKTLENYVKL